MPYKALSVFVRCFLFSRQFIRRIDELRLEALCGPVSGILYSSSIRKCSMRLSEALQAVFSLNVKLYAENINSRYKPADSLWEYFYAAARMWYALWSHHRAYKRVFIEAIIFLPPILSTPATRALRGWERRCRRALWLWKHHLEHMYALWAFQRLYKRRKFLTSIYMSRISKVDTGNVRGSQRHTEAVRWSELGVAARIDKSTTPL